MILLIDADPIVYAAGFVIKEGEPLEFALNIAKNRILGVMNNFNCERENVRVFLSGEGNFRAYLATRKEYKVSRKNKPKPLYYNEIREYLIKQWDAELSVGEEADDLVCIQHMKYYRQDKKLSVICSIDKDLNNVPGLHYNYVKNVLTDISPAKAYYNFCKQMLVGDPVDDIPGVPGIGDKKATKILANATTVLELESIVLEVYLSMGLTYDDFLEAGRLLFIRTKPGQIWNSKIKRVSEDGQCHILK